jgi:hypothetical protein
MLARAADTLSFPANFTLPFTLYPVPVGAGSAAAAGL